ncbi:MAG: hypothetical protein GYA50_08515 [Eubacteriaceae bacterium]|nr:hypothetical protein [Eubacteriaceae bacterium]
MSEDIKCKHCGGDVTIDVQKGIYTCNYCGSSSPLPVEELQQIELERNIKQEHIQNIKQKRLNKVQIICIVAIFSIIAIALIFTKLIIPGYKYNKATHLMKDQQYMQAQEIFQRL